MSIKAEDNNIDDQKWDKVLEVSSMVSKMFPEAILVGGTATAIYAGHRFSKDNDHILPDLKHTFDNVLSHLESLSNWNSVRTSRPNMILGNLDGIETGFLQQRRSEPLDFEIVNINGYDIRIPTPEELFRVKVFLALERNATRDYLDVAALYDLLGEDRAFQSLHKMDEMYPQRNDDLTAVRMQAIKQFSEPRPFDLKKVDLSKYKGIKPPYDEWDNVKNTISKLSSNYSRYIIKNINTLKNGSSIAEKVKQFRDSQESGSEVTLNKLPGLK